MHTVGSVEPMHINVDAIRSDDSGRRFWAYVTTVPLTLLTLASCLAAWSPETARERWWLAGAGVMFVERIGTFGYFIPQLLKLMQPERLTRDEAAQVARTWRRLNYARAALAFAGWLAALRALSASGYCEPASVALSRGNNLSCDPDYNRGRSVGP
jgi:hypothetical protein